MTSPQEDSLSGDGLARPDVDTGSSATLPRPSTPSVDAQHDNVPGGASGDIISVGDRYEVHVGPGALSQLTRWVPAGRRVMVIHQPGRDALVGEVTDLVKGAGGQPFSHEVPDAEAAKDVTVLAGAWAALGRAGFTRDDLIVGVGGGAATDLAGFVAASWLRGVDVVQLPTSLLGVVDAAVGGKTGINTAEGKNLVGAFHEPQAVLCDPAWMASMPRPDLVSGLAEVIKCGFIADPVILDRIEDDPAAACDPGAPVMTELIARAVRVKAEVVENDLKEAGIREILNYGHTFAHAIEQVEDYRWRHGDAVAVGMVFAAELAVRAAVLDPAVLARHRAVLESVGLPTTYAGAGWDQLRAAMARDKKARGATLRFIVLTGVGSTQRLQGPDEELLMAAFRAIQP
ncbi:3-dehydroquinate synthase [Ornithinimicrobium sp. F0845]|uniref:3-dehydroquinate synthase n=1 Tax=Ornithinimicrobium sp. F0845 TaxID=2926412 RepID=UPI001FF1A00B|nr:3-dehydroquinate synthase [Ornithinimicrobium sp. F0845]MCK0114256.1 3-dehydroquinate synthase [Ornithinimicrobium sp. F0845]